MAFATNMERHIVLDGLPQNVGPERSGKLQQLLEKKIKDMIDVKFSLKMVTGADGCVSGAFIEFLSTTEADKAAVKLNKFRFTKADVFVTNRWSDFETSANTPDEYKEPKDDVDDVGETDMTNLFMADVHARPQLLVKHGDKYDVHWKWLNTTVRKFVDARPQVELTQWVETDKRLTRLQKPMPEPLPMWSPHGNYVLTTIKDGIRVWGGRSMQPLTDLSIPSMEQVVMSGNEKYLVTLSPDAGCTFWDVRLGKAIRSMPGHTSVLDWQYNADDSLVAVYIPGNNAFNIYDAATMKLLPTIASSKRTMEVFGMSSFHWSPTNPKLFAYVISGDSAEGQRVHLDMVSDRDEDGTVEMRQVCRRTFFKTDEVNLSWHPMGTYMAAKMTTYRWEFSAEAQDAYNKKLSDYKKMKEQHDKLVEKHKATAKDEPKPPRKLNRKRMIDEEYKKKTGKERWIEADPGEHVVDDVSYTIFTVSSSTVTVEALPKIPKAGRAHRFAWQPNAARIALLTAAKTTGVSLVDRAKSKVHFYQVEKVGFKAMGSFETEGQQIIWAPKGTRCLIMDTDKSRLEIYGVQGTGPFPSELPMSKINDVEHPLPTNATWDPTGRFLASYTSAHSQPMNNSWNVWDVNGQKIFDMKTTKLSHVMWRPLAPSLLTDEDLKKVARELPKKSAEYTKAALEEQKRNDESSSKQKNDKVSAYRLAMDKVFKWDQRDEQAAARQTLIESAPAMKRLRAALKKLPAITEEVEMDEESSEPCE